MMHDYLRIRASATRVAVFLFAVVMLFFWSVVSAQTREGTDMYVPIAKSLATTAVQQPASGT